MNPVPPHSGSRLKPLQEFSESESAASQRPASQAYTRGTARALGMSLDSDPPAPPKVFVASQSLTFVKGLEHFLEPPAARAEDVISLLAALNELKDMPAVHSQLVKRSDGLFFDYDSIDQQLVEKQPPAVRERIEAAQRATKQQALAKIAVLPAIMCVCYLILIGYFKSRGGYKAQVLTGHSADDKKFTGGVPGAIEA